MICSIPALSSHHHVFLLDLSSADFDDIDHTLSMQPTFGLSFDDDLLPFNDSPPATSTKRKKEPFIRGTSKMYNLHPSSTPVKSSPLASDHEDKNNSVHSSEEALARKGKGHPIDYSLGRKKKPSLADLTQPQCVKVIITLQAKLHAYAKQQTDFKTQLKMVQARLATVWQEKNDIQKKLDSSHAKLLLRGSSANNVDVSLPITKELKELIESQTKTILWGMVKFIQSPEEEMMAAKMLIKCADGLPDDSVATKEDREALANTYKGYIRKAIFQRRNYVAAEHKKVMVKRFMEKGSMPTVHQLLKCLRRQISSDKDYEILEFYWEELLPKQVGSCVWSKEVRNYTTICDAIRKDVTHKKLPMITPEDEAFTVLVIENSLERWLTEVNEKNGVQQQERKKRPASYYNGLFTLTDSGQNEWGGWTEEGLTLFNKYVDMNRAARKEKTTPDVERACLARLKKKYKIVCHDHKTQTDLNKKRKRKKGGDEELGGPNKKKTLFTIRPEYHQVLFSDDEGDEALSDNEDGTFPTRSK